MEVNHDETTSYDNNKNGDLEDEEEWGTLEELLLLCAINRHGTHSWDFISKELHKRIQPSKDLLLEDSSFSSQNCCKKYVHLKRRFSSYDGTGNNGDEGEHHLLRMVDELRKLRVEELKRQVHNHDASIVSLQLKVKRLEEEREKSKEDRVLSSDLRNNKPEEKNVKLKKPEEPVITGDSAENRSCNESNSTKLRCEEEPDPVRPENNKKNKPKRKQSEPVGESKVSQLGELGESLSESRKEQSSEVQSSASLSKKKRRRIRGGDNNNNSGDDLEVEEISPANKRINIKSRPLIRFFETLRSHKHGTVFNRRLPSQETEKYRNVIRQHLDLDTIQSRIDKGIYCECHSKFYRDLLLVFTNALLFYRKSSAEHIAARELRKLVIDEINQKMPKPKIQPRIPDLEPQHLEPVVKKPRSSTTMVLCRKRSSSSMQTLSDSLKKGDNTDNKSNSNSKITIKMENGQDEKIKPDILQKKDNGSYSHTLALSSEEESKKGGVDASLKNLLAKDRSSFGNGGLRLSSNNGKKIISKDGSKREKIGNVDKEESSEGVGSQVGEKKIKVADQKEEKGTPTLLKKQGVANFLKRMNQNSPSSQEKVKNNDFEDEKNEETKLRRRDKTQSTRNSNVKKPSVNTRKNTKGSITRSSSRRGEKETDASRRGISRPAKLMSSSSALDSVKGGRSGGRDNGENSKKKPRR